MNSIPRKVRLRRTHRSRIVSFRVASCPPFVVARTNDKLRRGRCNVKGELGTELVRWRNDARLEDMGAAEELAKLPPCARESVLIAHKIRTNSASKVAKVRGTTRQNAHNQLTRRDSVSVLTQLTQEELDRGRGVVAQLRKIHAQLVQAVAGSVGGFDPAQSMVALKLVGEALQGAVKLEDSFPPTQDRPEDWVKAKSKMIRRAARLGALLVRVERAGGGGQPTRVDPTRE